MATYTKLKHIRFDEETERKHQEIVEHLWKKKNLPGKPKDSEGHRLTVHTLHNMLFEDVDIDISQVQV